METNITKTAILLYLCIVSIILYIRPAFMIDTNGHLKKFGTGEEETLLPLWALLGFFAVISYIITIVYLI